MILKRVLSPKCLKWGWSLLFLVFTRGNNQANSLSLTTRLMRFWVLLLRLLLLAAMMKTTGSCNLNPRASRCNIFRPIIMLVANFHARLSSPGFAKISRKLNPTPAHPACCLSLGCCLSRVRGLQQNSGNLSVGVWLPGAAAIVLEMPSAVLWGPPALTCNQRNWRGARALELRQGLGSQETHRGHCPHGESAQVPAALLAPSAGRRAFKQPREGRTQLRWRGASVAS